MRDSTTPTQKREITLDNIGLHRAKREYKSQPRHGINQRRNNQGEGIYAKPSQDIEFHKNLSQRKERLSNFYYRNSKEFQRPKKLVRDLSKISLPVKNTNIGNTFSKREERLKPIDNNFPQKPKNMYENVALKQRERTPTRKVLKPYNSRVGTNSNNQSFGKRDHSVNVLYQDKSKYNDLDISRNPKLAGVKSGINNKFKLNFSDRKDQSLIGGRIFKSNSKPKIPRPPGGGSLNPSYTGSISYNENLLNQMYAQRRNQREDFNKKAFMGYV